MTADLFTSKDLDQLGQALAAGWEISVARAVKAEADFAEARKHICKICLER